MCASNEWPGENDLGNRLSAETSKSPCTHSGRQFNGASVQTSAGTDAVLKTMKTRDLAAFYHFLKATEPGSARFCLVSAQLKSRNKPQS